MCHGATDTTLYQSTEKHSYTKISKALAKAVEEFGIVITSYEFVRSDVLAFQSVMWNYVILDEGQKIKNPLSQTHQAILALRARHRLILTGTPMQNNLTELWSLFDFV